MWKQTFGSEATYGKLIWLFERAGYNDLADTVRRIAPNLSGMVSMCVHVCISGYI
jgi:hypothetical protein